MSTMKSWLWSSYHPAVAIFVALIGSCLLVVGCDRGQQAGGGFTMPPLPVETELVTSGTVVDRFSAVGSVEASDAIIVMAEIDASVIALPFREGEPIAVGGLIAQLDDAELAAHVARAEAVRDQQRVTYERVRDIVEQRAGAPQDLDDAAAALKVAEAELNLARARLAKTRILAPFPGIVGRRLVSPGAFLRAGTPITELARIDELRVNFTAPERLLGRLRRGASVAIATIAFPDHELTGTIDVIDPVLDPGTRSARIVARVANRDRLLRPGMSADVSVVLSTHTNALTVPSEAVFVQSGQTLVYIVQADSSVAPRPVTLGMRLADSVEVVAGLEPGSRVVRAGHQKIYPGAKVIPIDSAAAVAVPADSTASAATDLDRAVDAEQQSNGDGSAEEGA